MAATSHAAKLKGYVWDVTERGLVVEGVDVELVPNVKVERKNQRDITAGDVRIGWEVEVEGDRRAQAFVAKNLQTRVLGDRP